MGIDEPDLPLDAGIIVQLAGADQIVGRIHVLSIDAFWYQPPNLLLCEVDCGPWITEWPKLLGVGRYFMQNRYDSGTANLRSALDDVKGFVLGHASLYSVVEVEDETIGFTASA